MVPADANDAAHGALLQFCVAKVRQRDAEAELAPLRRAAREQARAVSDRLAADAEHPVLHVPAAPGHGEMWVVVKPVLKPPRKVCADAVVDELRGATLDALGRCGGTLSEALREFLRGRLAPRPTARRTAAVVDRPPRGAARAPAAPPALADMARSLRQSKAAARARGDELKARTQPDAEACAAAEPAVRQYIERVSPVVNIAPVQLERGGTSSQFFVRARESRRSKSLTLKALLPVCERLIRESLLRCGMEGAPTEHSLQVVTSDAWLAELRAALEGEVERYRHEHSVRSSAVTLEARVPKRL